MRFIAFIAFIISISAKSTLSAQEFRGIDFKLSVDTNDIVSDFRLLTIDLYFKSPDTIQMDSLSTVCYAYWRKIPKTEHLFFDNNIQLLRFEHNVHLYLGANDCSTEEFLIEGIVNYHNGLPVSIPFITEFFYNTVGQEDPYFNALQTDAYFEDGVFYFDASGVDPNGQNLGYYMETLIYPDTNTENYQLPIGTDTIRLDPLSGALVWDRPTVPGKYLIVIEYAQSFAAVPPAWAGTSTRYMVIEVKPEDIVSSDKEKHFEDEIRIYPNPARERINIEIAFQEANLKEFSLSIKNIIGQPLYYETLLTTSNKIEREIKISGWSPGIYLLTFRTGAEIRTEKIVVY